MTGTRTSHTGTLNRHLRTTVHRNAAGFELDQAFHHILLPQNVHDLSQMVQESSC